MAMKFSRTELLIGSDSMKILSKSTAAIFGIGGVGSFTAEALARSGVGTIFLIDHDAIDVTNINRQIHALTSTVGKSKVATMKSRLLDINPNANVETIEEFYSADNADDMFGMICHEKTSNIYIVDAIDNIRGKISLVRECSARKIPIVSCMGMAGKLDPTQIKVSDIFKTTVDPIARIMRRELKKLGIPQLKVVYSTEEPRKKFTSDKLHRAIPGSIAFVPSAAGLVLAGVVVRDLIGQ